MVRQYELVERVKAYDSNADEEALNRAYVFSLKVHGSQKRASGEPYFLHPLEVANILISLYMDTATIVTALLHDTVEDTSTTLDEIIRLFGPEVAQLVDGVTNLSRIELSHRAQQNLATKEAENFRKLFMAMSKDIRVLLIKIADRLHNMRTLHYLNDPQTRQRIALETLEVYAPLTARIGIESMKDELEDLAFSETNPEARQSIRRKLTHHNTADHQRIHAILDELKATLQDKQLPNLYVTGRSKSPYSIWCKLKRRKITFDQLSDIMAFRVIVETVDQCYQVLGFLHGRYAMIPGRFKDYISTPKRNGYRSLHTGLIGPYKERIEVQIRTQEMHSVAELGVASHWAYKQSQQPSTETLDSLGGLIEIVDHPQKPEEWFEHVKLELYPDQVFCFTPKGQVISLPPQATPIDFAYAVHSEIGDHCVGSKINGRMQPLRSQLVNGDQVEILTSKTQTPSPDWERLVVTGKAKSCIRRFFRAQQRIEYIQLGHQMLQKAARQEGHELTDKHLERILETFNMNSVDDLLANVGSGIRSRYEIIKAIFPKAQISDRDDNPSVPNSKSVAQIKKSVSPLEIIGLIPGMAVHYARCCHPLVGDRISGIITTGKGVTIHTRDCETLDSFTGSPERIIAVSWGNGHDDRVPLVGRINVVYVNQRKNFSILSTLIEKRGGHIKNIKIINRNINFFEVLIDIDVHDAHHLTDIMAALRGLSMVTEVNRPRGH